MINLVYLYRGKSRELRRIIVALLKSGFVIEIKKINYVQDFVLVDSKVKKMEIKMIIITTENEEKLVDFLSKNFSQIERIHLN